MSTTTSPESATTSSTPAPNGAPSNGTAAAPEAPKSGWTVDAAKALYNIDGWGDGFFDVNDKGHVVVRPDKDRADHTLDLYELACDLEAQGVFLPVLLRFSDILRSR